MAFPGTPGGSKTGFLVFNAQKPGDHEAEILNAKR